MPRPRQSALERFFFQEFSKSYPLLPTGTVAFGDKPDVVVHGLQTFGIEIANVYLRDGSEEGSEQVQARRRAQAIALAQQLYRAAGNPALEYWIDFDPSTPIHSVPDAAARLAATAAANSTAGVPFARYRPEPDFAELRSLAHNGVIYPDAEWRPSQVYEVPNLSVSRVRDIVNDKMQKVPAYAKCDVYWLLLVVDFWDPAQDQAIH